MLVKREISSHIRKLAKQLPVVTITGPRQSGKTTVAKEVFKNKPYLNLEIPDIREFAITDPRGFLSDIPKGAIIDEIQRAPNLTSYIQGIVDEKKVNGMFILTGSQQLAVSNTISQSLAGRTALVKLLPFSLQEVTKNYKKPELNDLLYSGFYPRIYEQKLDPTQTMADYFETYVERDLRQLAQIKNLNLFQKFVKLCAGRAGQILNLHNLASDVGVSHTTAREWITLLEASYVVFLLQPYHTNINKRLIKSPKLYFYDVGLVSYLLGIENKNQVATHPLRGHLFENMIVVELLKNRYNKGMSNNLNFYRDSNGNEVDILYATENKIFPIEVKAGETFTSDYLKGINSFNKNFPNLSKDGAVIYAGKLNQTRNKIKIWNYSKLKNLF